MNLTSILQTMVIVDTFAVNMRKEFWGMDAHIYRPSRFLEFNEKNVSETVFFSPAIPLIQLSGEVPVVEIWARPPPVHGQISC